MRQIPRVIAMVAPSAAPDEIPVVYGSARGFFIMLCMAAPAIARPIPARRAAMTRGMRRFHTTLMSVDISCPQSMILSKICW